jgi:hypothetical protein
MDAVNRSETIIAWSCDVSLAGIILKYLYKNSSACKNVIITHVKLFDYLKLYNKPDGILHGALTLEKVIYVADHLSKSVLVRYTNCNDLVGYSFCDKVKEKV